MRKNVSVIRYAMPILEYALPITISPLGEGGYLARCEQLQGCMAEGETVEEALSAIVDIAKNIIDIRKEEHLKIPLKIVKKINTTSSSKILIPLIYQPSHA